MDQKDFRCFCCSRIIPGDINRLMCHFRVAHNFRTANRNRHHLICGQNSCEVSCETFSSYRWHLKTCSALDRDLVEIDIDVDAPNVFDEMTDLNNGTIDPQANQSVDDIFADDDGIHEREQPD